jgi:hypothetical protein
MCIAGWRFEFYQSYPLEIGSRAKGDADPQVPQAGKQRDELPLRTRSLA